MVKSLRNTTSIFSLILLLSSCDQQKAENNETPVIAPISETETNELPTFVQILEECYGSHFSVLDSNQILWNDGDTLILDDGITKSCEIVITEADIQDQFRTVYPKGKRLIPRDKCFDPGRIRNEQFFRKMYGETEKAVKVNLDTIWWPSLKEKQALRVSIINGCRDSLQKVANELEIFPDSLKEYIGPSAGTYKYRKIAGTDRLSCHSYGIAIDINVKYSNYWRWVPDKKNVEYKNSIPYEIVEVFEKYGFIWGGYWYHYDTMHFEFRPELIKFAMNE